MVASGSVDVVHWTLNMKPDGLVAMNVPWTVNVKSVGLTKVARHVLRGRKPSVRKGR